jgi:inosine-uridine nucleoside N-ribohydrolase
MNVNRPIILDADMDTDCDDAGALAVLHALENQGACNILGIVVSAPPVEPGVGAVRAINNACGRPHLPVGAATIAAEDAAWRSYHEHRQRLAEGLYGDLRPYNHIVAARSALQQTPATDAVTLYRSLLTGAPDGAVTICAIGMLSALAQLLDSKADTISPLSGRELVAQKVERLVSMAIADFPSGFDGFNWRMHLESAAHVLHNWPTPLVVSSRGESVLTGAEFCELAPSQHPVRIAYETFLGGCGRNRPSWDQIAVLTAVHPAASDICTLSEARSIELDPTSGRHDWSEYSTDFPRFYTQSQMSDRDLEQLIEQLMLQSLR